MKDPALLLVIILVTFFCASGEGQRRQTQTQEEVKKAAEEDQQEEQTQTCSNDNPNSEIEDTDDDHVIELVEAMAPWDDVSQVHLDKRSVRKTWDETRRYMRKVVYVDDEYEKVRDGCRNRDRACTWWASTGVCSSNKPSMRKHCAAACGICEELDWDKRCPVDVHAPGFFQSGDLHKMYERILTHPYYAKYSPNALSEPPDGPYIVALDKFLTPEECDELIKVGAEPSRFQQSIGGLKKNADGSYTRQSIDEYRTSSSAFCLDEGMDKHGCAQTPIIEHVAARIDNITGTPHGNAGFLQFLRYNETQFYKIHSDFIAEHNTEQQHGVRMMTFLCYLTNVTQGGGTRFPRLDLTATPKVGRCILFPNVLNDFPTKQEERTHHEALPVVEGIKIAFMMYIHQKEYKIPFRGYCVR